MKIKQLLIRAEIIHYVRNHGDLLETPEDRWTKEQQSVSRWRKKEKKTTTVEPVGKSVRDVKNEVYRADFAKISREDEGNFSISYYDVNARVTERIYFGKSDDVYDVGYSYITDEELRKLKTRKHYLN